MSVIRTQKPASMSLGEEVKSRGKTTKQMAQALVKLLAAREQLDQALAFVPNAVTRAQVDESLRASIRDIITDISANEGL